MFSIKSQGSETFSAIFFPQSFLPVIAWKTTKKNIENLSGSPKYDAKQWAYVSVSVVPRVQEDCRLNHGSSKNESTEIVIAII